MLENGVIGVEAPWRSVITDQWLGARDDAAYHFQPSHFPPGCPARDADVC